MPQKKSLGKMERQQRLKDSGEKKEKGKLEKTIGSLDIPDMKSEELMEQFGKMKAITPYGLANQFNIKVSTAKRLLEKLRKDNVIRLVSRSHNLKVYALAGD